MRLCILTTELHWYIPVNANAATKVLSVKFAVGDGLIVCFSGSYLQTILPTFKSSTTKTCEPCDTLVNIILLIFCKNASKPCYDTGGGI